MSRAGIENSENTGSQIVTEITTTVREITTRGILLKGEIIVLWAKVKTMTINLHLPRNLKLSNLKMTLTMQHLNKSLETIGTSSYKILPLMVLIIVRRSYHFK